MLEEKVAKKIEREKGETEGFSLESELDIEAILNEKEKPEYHYRDSDGTMTIVEKNTKFCSEKEVAANNSVYNRNHSAMLDRESIEKNRKLAKRNRKRTLETIIAAGLIIIVGIFFALILYPQAELAELSRDNSDRKDEITLLKREILKTKEETKGLTDSDSIRAQAMALGMKDPSSNQIVYIPLPGTDRIISVATFDSAGIDDNALEIATENLKDYYHQKEAQD